MAKLPLDNTLTLQIERVSNMKLLNISDDFPMPQIPTFYIESQDRWVENPDHPDYHNALYLKQLSLALASYDYLIDNCVTIIGDTTPYIRGKQKMLTTESDIKKYIIDLFDAEEKVIRLAALCEADVDELINKMPIMRNGANIYTVQLTNSLNTAIHVQPMLIGTKSLQLVHPLDEYACVKDASLDLDKWIRNEYPLNVMATAMALHRASQIIEIHVNDAAQIESDKKSKKNK